MDHIFTISMPLKNLQRLQDGNLHYSDDHLQVVIKKWTGLSPHTCTTVLLVRGGSSNNN